MSSFHLTPCPLYIADVIPECSLTWPGLEMYNGRISHEVKRSVRARERGKITPCHFDTQRYIRDTKSIWGWFALSILNRGRGEKNMLQISRPPPKGRGVAPLSLSPFGAVHI